VPRLDVEWTGRCHYSSGLGGLRHLQRWFQPKRIVNRTFLLENGEITAYGRWCWLKNLGMWVLYFQTSDLNRYQLVETDYTYYCLQNLGTVELLYHSLF
jgi:hypothetical protein